MDNTYWPLFTMQWFASVKAEIDKAVKFTDRGKTAKFQGKMPREYCQLVSPSEDPEAFF